MSAPSFKPGDLVQLSEKPALQHGISPAAVNVGFFLNDSPQQLSVINRFLELKLTPNTVLCGFKSSDVACVIKVSEIEGADPLVAVCVSTNSTFGIDIISVHSLKKVGE